MSVTTRGRRFGGSAVAAALACSLCSWVVGEDRAAAFPRYRFEVGQELVYELTSGDVQSGNRIGAELPRNRRTWRVFVTRRNTDGSWRLFIRTDIRLVTSEGEMSGAVNSLGYCDLKPDGSYSLDERTAIFKKLFPYQIFCRLPDRESELADVWEYVPPLNQVAYAFRLDARENALLRIRAQEETTYESMHSAQSTSRYDFNIERGVIERIVMDSTWPRPDGVRRDRQTFELTSVVKHEPAWIAQFHAEAEDYLSACNQWIRLGTDALWVHHAADAERLVQDARAALVAGRATTENEIIRAVYDANLREFDGYRNSLVDTAQQREAFFAAVPTFATDWQVRTLDGGTFRLADHHGKVVVLHFWGTSCEYCVPTAEQIADLADEYRGKDVAFVGMFDRSETDDPDAAARQEASARTFIERVHSSTVNAEASEVVELYRLREFGYAYPALVVLDPSGVVHEMHVGYTGDLTERLRKIIDTLLSGRVTER